MQSHFEFAGFSVRIAVDDERDRCLAVRHRTFCEELGYFPSQAEGREEDQDDDRSHHILVTSLATGEDVGCVRVIQDRPGRPLPGLSHASLHPHAGWLRSARLAEISRISVLKAFRTPLLEAYPWSPGALVALAAGLTALHEPIDYALLFSQPGLVLLLNSVHITPREAGPEVDFKGVRRLYYLPRQPLQGYPQQALPFMCAMYAGLFPGEPLPLELEVDAGPARLRSC